MRRREIIERLQEEQIYVRSLPSLSNIIEGSVTVNDLREIQIEELLGREAVAPNELLMGRTIAGKTVLVSGAGGSIGSELCRQILRCHPARDRKSVVLGKGVAVRVGRGGCRLIQK